MKTIFTLLNFALIVSILNAQTTLTGKVSDSKNEIIAGANIFIKDSYDGSSSDANGNYKLETKLTGKKTLIVSFIGYKNHEQEIELLPGKLIVDVILKEDNNMLDAVEISAGVFEASDTKKAVVLQPLDIVTTASAAADIYGAISTLPGAQTVGEEGGLFVRGGDKYETKTFIDGILVDKPYGSKMPDLPSRGRFSPFLFKGTMFSSGGYSAEYGQALSSALILQTEGLPDKTQSSISLMTIGGGAAHTQVWKNTSVSAEVNYANLSPYFNLVKQEVKWEKSPEEIGGNVAFRKKFSKTGLLKSFITLSNSNSKLSYPTFEINQYQNIKLYNNNIYVNNTYTDEFGKNWILRSGLAYTNDQENFDIDKDKVKTNSQNMQVKVTLQKEFSKHFSLLFGSDMTYNYLNQDYNSFIEQKTYNTNFDDNNTSVYIESEIKLNGTLAARVGGRMEHSTLLNSTNIAPRVSFAIKFTDAAQCSFAYGDFYQSPQQEALRFKHGLKPEKANHYIMNFQYTKDERVFRLEGYYKNYDDLVKYLNENNPDPNTYNNNGKGFAKGLDIFWRDRATFSNVDYWISYSYIDTKRDYRDYLKSATPTFVSNHNFHFVYKQYIPKITSMVGFTYSFASGRPYYNPNENDFLSDRTKSYNDLSVNISYLTTIFKNFTVIYASVNNLLGTQNIFSYRYSNQPDDNGVYQSRPITEGAKRFLFLGVFISISK